MSITIIIFFFFNDTATTEIYTLSLHDALPICAAQLGGAAGHDVGDAVDRLRALVVVVVSREHQPHAVAAEQDRKSTRLNSSHANISYAVFCLKKKNPRQSRCRLAENLLSSQMR